MALWSRSAVLLDLNRGSDALVDIQSAIDNGLDDVKKQLEYYVRLAKANASKYTTGILCVTTSSIYIHFLCDFNEIRIGLSYALHFFFLSMNNAFSCMINTFHSNVKVFHSFRMNFVFLVMGNVGKTKICLNLVKNFCGIGSHYDQIENEIKQIKPSPTTLKIEGKNISN